MPGSMWDKTKIYLKHSRHSTFFQWRNLKQKSLDELNPGKSSFFVFFRLVPRISTMDQWEEFRIVYYVWQNVGKFTVHIDPGIVLHCFDSSPKQLIRNRIR